MRCALLPLLALAACDSPISNRMFYEDAEFLAAVPSFADHPIAVPGGPAAATLALDPPVPGQATDLRAQGAGVAAQLTAALADLALLAAWIRYQEPSLREDDLRSWGPGSLENGTRALLVVDVIRSGLGQYDWAYQLSNSSRGPWEDFYVGTHFAGATVATGDGHLTADIAALASYLDEAREGFVTCTYDFREGTGFDIDLAGYRAGADEEPVDAHYRYRRDPGGAGDFQYGLDADIIAGSDLERSSVRERWIAGGAMRADLRLEGGDLGEVIYTLSQCWDDAGVLVYQADSLGLVEPLGVAWACAFRKPEYAEGW
ncbi:MAG: hypothetical protein ABIO70_11100 [Pseudomonadota bacterium]